MADLDNSNFLAGAVLAVEREGTAYTVSQVPHTQDYPNPRVLSGMRRVFQYRVGPLSLNGYVNLQSKEIIFEVTIFGIKLGNFYGHIDDPEGTLVRIDLFQAKGQLRLYTKNGNELWMYEELDIKDSGAYNENIKLAGW